MKIILLVAEITLEPCTREEVGPLLVFNMREINYAVCGLLALGPHQWE
jgi:hypothetical protein